MTLVCDECEGPLEIKNVAASKFGVTESYECKNCGSMGTMNMDYDTGEKILNGVKEI